MRTTTDGEPIVHVHVENPDDLRVLKTEEVEPEHYTLTSYTPPSGEIIGTGVQAVEPTQLLQLDPMRKRAVLTFNGSGQVILAHSMQQASSLAQNIQQAADAGCLVTAPGAISAEATGPMWAVLVPSTANPPINTPSTPVTGTGAANSAEAITTPAGVAGQSYIITSINYSFSAPTTAATTVVLSGGGNQLVVNVPTGVTAGSVTLPAGGLLIPAGQQATLTVGAGGVGITSTANLSYLSTSASSVTVGVSQERRGSA